MALYMIGIGLNDEKDITLKGLELVKKSEIIYLENYTSVLNVSVKKLEDFYGKKIIVANREMVENDINKILGEAKEKDVSFLVVGDIFAATTHTGIFLEAQKQEIHTEVVHNASIFNALSDIGLFFYQFGKITSIPFNNEEIITPVNVFKDNFEKGYHTLFLLDLDPKNNKFMSISEAVNYLISRGLDENLLSIACSRMGGMEQEIKVGNLSEFKNLEFKKFPHCLIIPGKMHFLEEEAIERFLNK